MLRATTSRTSFSRIHTSLDPSGDQSKVEMRPSVKWVSFRA